MFPAAEHKEAPAAESAEDEFTVPEDDLFPAAEHKEAPAAESAEGEFTVTEDDLFPAAEHKEAPAAESAEENFTVSEDDLFPAAEHKEAPAAESTEEKFTVTEDDLFPEAEHKEAPAAESAEGKTFEHRESVPFFGDREAVYSPELTRKTQDADEAFDSLLKSIRQRSEFDEKPEEADSATVFVSDSETAPELNAGEERENEPGIYSSAQESDADKIFTFGLTPQDFGAENNSEDISDDESEIYTPVRPEEDAFSPYGGTEKFEKIASEVSAIFPKTTEDAASIPIKTERETVFPSPAAEREDSPAQSNTFDDYLSESMFGDETENEADGTKQYTPPEKPDYVLPDEPEYTLPEEPTDEFFSDPAEERTRRIDFDAAEYIRHEAADGKTREIKPSPHIRVGEDGIRMKPFERPGIVTGKTRFDNVGSKTGDLHEVPTILPAHEVFEQNLGSEQMYIRTGTIPIPPGSGQQRQSPSGIDGQLMIPGFDGFERVRTMSEAEMESELLQNRSEVVRTFKIDDETSEEWLHSSKQKGFEELSKDSAAIGVKPKRFSITRTASRLNRQATEYEKPRDLENVAGFLKHGAKQATVGALAALVCLIPLIVFACFPSLTASLNAAASEDFLGGASLANLVSFVLIAVAFGFNLPNCIDGVKTLVSGRVRANAETAVFAAGAVCTLQSLVASLFWDRAAQPSPGVFAACAALILFLNALSRRSAYARTKANFRFLVSRGREGLFCVQTLDKASGETAGQNALPGETDIRYSCKARFATRFISHSFASGSVDDVCAKLVPIALGLSVMFAIVSGVITKSAMWALSTFSAAVCMAVPAAAALASNFSLSGVNKHLRRQGAIITGYAAAFECETTNAVAVNAAQLFPSDKCAIHGIKEFNGTRVDEAILLAASAAIAAGGPLGGLFNEIVVGRKELLMEVEDLTYEDKLGLSCWIRARRVLMGNRNLMLHHNIELPEECRESRYEHDGRRIVYVASGGKLAAMFVVGYGTQQDILEALQKIERSGITILVNSTDSGITESLVADTFRLPVNSVKVVSAAAGKILRECEETTLLKADAKLLHNGSLAAYLQTVCNSGTLCSIAGINATVQMISVLPGMLAIAITSFFADPGQITPLQIIIYQLVWTFISMLVPMLKRD